METIRLTVLMGIIGLFGWLLGYACGYIAACRTRQHLDRSWQDVEYNNRIADLNQIQSRLDRYEWSDVVDAVEYCPCCQADKASGHSSWCCLYASNVEAHTSTERR